MAGQVCFVCGEDGVGPDHACKVEAAVAFFYEHAGWSYDPATQTPEEGRQACAIRLAEAERWLLLQDGHTEWLVDSDADRDDIEHDGPLYGCVVKVACGCDRPCCSGWWTQSLWSIDLGPSGEPDDYQRVVQAELALELQHNCERS